MKVSDVLIIGGGPGGMYAFYYTKHKGLKPCLIESNKSLGGQPSGLFSFKTIKDFPGFSKIKANDLIEMFIKQVKDEKEVYLNQKAVKITKDLKNDYFKVETESKKIFYAKYIILATGLGLINFNRIENDQFVNIHYVVKSLDTYKNKKVFILGGGDSAIDWANEMLIENITKKLNIVHHRDQFRASGENANNVLKSKNVKVHFNSKVEIIDEKNLIIKNNDGKIDKQSYDFVIVQYGQKFDNSILKMCENIKVANNNKIIVDYVGKTNIKNIFAIGDNAYMEDKPNLISIAITDAIKTINYIVKLEKKYE